MGHLQQAGRCIEHIAGQPEPRLLPCRTKSAEWLFQKDGLIVLEHQLRFCLCAVGRVVKTDDMCDKLHDSPNGGNNNRWEQKKNTLVHYASGGCLDVMDDPTLRLVINDCNVRERPSQIWHFNVNI